MMIRPNSRNSCNIWLVWLGILAGFSMIAACGGGGGGKASTAGTASKPSVSISSPTDANFKEGENIAFSGTATDSNGSQLTGSALVWSSNIDGQIGTGETLITSALSAGDHMITLTANGSNGAGAATKNIAVAQTRFVKMGLQTTGVTDASNAFDGDMNTAATIMTPGTEFVHFKANLGIADTFHFKIKVGKSTSGSLLSIQALNTADTWQRVKDVNPGSEKTVAIKVINAQNYKDADGYINLRVSWQGGADGDVATIFEIWRIDPAYNGPETSQNVVSSEDAFDNDSSTFATLPPAPDFLNSKAYVGPAETAVFKVSVDALDGSHNTLFIDAKNDQNVWDTLGTFNLDFTQTTTLTVTINNVQSYLDESGYINLRAIWTKGDASTNLNIREIWRNDLFFVGDETTNGIVQPENAVDGKLDTSAQFSNYWGEDGHSDFLHLQTYVGDADTFVFYISAPPSTAGSKMVIDAKIAPDHWWTIRGIGLDAVVDKKSITIPSAHSYTDADGFINLRAKWESGSSSDDAYLNEVWQERN